MTGRFEKRNLLPDEQHGFAKRASTTTQLLYCFHDWISVIINRLSVNIIYFDLSKAFNRVIHCNLVMKLESSGVRSPILRWFKLYLSHRYLWVVQSFSSCYPVTSWVPQGCTLSPALFLCCLHIPFVLKTHCATKAHLYAEDRKVYGIFDSNNQRAATEALNDSIARLAKWSKEWDIPINLSKYFVVHLGRGFRSLYMYEDVILDARDRIGDLGVMVSSNLDFSDHINDVVRKATAYVFDF